MVAKKGKEERNNNRRNENKNIRLFKTNCPYSKRMDNKIMREGVYTIKNDRELSPS